MIHIGIDPGKSGAVAVISDDYANVWDTPVRAGTYDLTAMAHLIASIVGDEAHATLEGALSMPGQAVQATAAQWRGVGLWEGILAALGIEYTVVSPSVWKRALGLTDSTLTNRERKELSIVRARDLFPAAAHLIYRAKDEGRAEALLLAHFGRTQAARLPI